MFAVEDDTVVFEVDGPPGAFQGTAGGRGLVALGGRRGGGRGGEVGVHQVEEAGPAAETVRSVEPGGGVGEEFLELIGGDVRALLDDHRSRARDHGGCLGSAAAQEPPAIDPGVRVVVVGGRSRVAERHDRFARSQEIDGSGPVAAG